MHKFGQLMSQCFWRAARCAAIQILALWMTAIHKDVNGAKGRIGEIKGNIKEITEKSIHFAMSKLETLLTPQELDKVQKTAFDAGLLIQTVLHVIGIDPRDAIFADRGLNAEKLDVHDAHLERLE